MPTKSRILVTGFSNYGNVTANPSEQLVRELAKHYGDRIRTHVFTYGYRGIDVQLPSLLADNPSVIIMFGLSSRTPFVRLEQTVRLPRGLTGEATYSSTLPLEHLLAAIQAKDIDVRYSENAGTYFCNYVFYKVRSQTTVPAGFIHIPDLAKYQQATGKALDLSLVGQTVVNLFVELTPHSPPIAAIPAQAGMTGQGSLRHDYGFVTGDCHFSTD